MVTLTKSTGTVTLSGDVEKVTFPSAYDWVWFRNMSDADMFAGLSEDISEGADGVAVIPAGGCRLISTEGLMSVCLLGTGSVEISAQRHTDCPFKLGGKGGVTIGSNLIINPDFKINQRGVSGTFSETGKYFVDRWRLVSGAVTVNADGTLTLNGTISQIFENAVGDNVTASVSAGTAVYDNSTKTFSITANGEIISWAKLEYGSNATQFFPPDTATELLKCMHYYEKIVCSSGLYTVACQFFNNLEDISFAIPMTPKRLTSPTSTIDYSAMVYVNSENIVNVSSARAVAYANNSVSIVANLLSPTTVCTHGWAVGFTIEIDAEIY